MISKKPIHPITEKHLKLLQDHQYDVKSVAEAEVVVGMMPEPMQIEFFRDADTPDADKGDEKNLSDLPAENQAQAEVDMGGPTRPDPAPPGKLAQRMCASCGAFIEHVPVKRSDPGTLHGTCPKCKAEFFNVGEKKSVEGEDIEAMEGTPDAA